MALEDRFSALAQEYARYRPGYPDELFAHPASLAPGHRLAWDVGTGSGQSAVRLAAYFERVAASDLSFEQVSRATPEPKVTYTVSLAERAPLASGSVNLVTVATAVHWFDLDSFYREVHRVLQPGGVLALWGYHFGLISPEIDALVKRYYYDLLGAYWPPQMRYLESRYRSLPFPIEELEPPQITIQAGWTLDELAGFLASWSATVPYQADRGRHPLEDLYPELARAWGEPLAKRQVRWPLFFRIGRVSGNAGR